MATFEKLRVSLARDEAGPVIGAAGGDDVHRSRSEYLVAAFAEPRKFLHSRSEKVLEFVPLPTPSGYVGGFFKRERPLQARHADLQPYDAENYESALLVLSVDKAQIAWMQQNGRLGAPKAILESFFLHLLKKTGLKDWRAFVEYMDSNEEYWSVIREHRAEIAKIQFTFIPPNALGADDRVYDFVKTMHTQAHPETQKHIYEAEPGRMNPEAPLMAASARVAMNGGGDAVVKDGHGKTLYTSSTHRTTETVDDEQMPTPKQPDFVRWVITKLFRQ